MIDEAAYKNQIAKEDRPSPFLFEDRESILGEIDAEPIVCAISSHKSHKYHLEEVFRSQNRLLLNSITTEFIFVLEFFDLKVA